MTPLWASRIAVTISLVIAIGLVLVRVLSDGILDTGDSVQHYLIAKFSWRHPRLFLDQWGKPLFVILSSPFTLLGYPGMTVFNAMLGVVATALASLLLRRSGLWSMLLFPVLCMLTPYMVQLTLNGMTEVLFGTLTVACVILLVKERPVAAAIVASLTPLSRPEYVVFVPVIAGWLILTRKWTALPLLVLGIGIYSVVGWVMTGDPLYWIHNDPYNTGESIYGAGDPLRFILGTPQAYGWTLVVLFLVALVVWPKVFRHDVVERDTHRLLLFTAAIPSLLIVAVHAYLHATGTHGSAGLVRVLTTGVPLTVLFAMFTLGRWIIVRPGLGRSIPYLAAFCVVCVVGQLLAFGPIIQRPTGDQQALHAACDRVAAVWQPGDRVFSTHPYAAFRLGLDGFDDDEFRMLWGFEGMGMNVPSRPRDLVIWESQMGPNECGVPLERFMEDTAFTALGVFEPNNGHFVIGGVAYEFWAFQRTPARRSSTEDTLLIDTRTIKDITPRFDTARCDGIAIWCGDSEFPWTAEGIPCTPDGVLHDDLICTVEVQYSDPEGENAVLVYRQMRGDEMLRYEERRLTPGNNSVMYRIPPCVPDVQQSLYFWAPGARSFRVLDMVVTRKRVIQQPL